MTDAQQRVDRERLVDAALKLGQRDGWESVRLHQVAAACGAGLDDVRGHFSEKDRIIDAWLDRADAAMLAEFDAGGLASLPPRVRIRKLMLAWLDSLAPYRRVTRQMIAHQLEPGHIHVQLPALLRISRTVQWLREGAMLDAPLPRRALEETALTALFVKTFGCWLGDASPGQRRTRQRLDRDLRCLEVPARLLPGRRSRVSPRTGRAPATGRRCRAHASAPRS